LTTIKVTYKYVFVPRKPSRTFTDRELEIMRIVWRLGEASAWEIQRRLPGDRHYNSVMTIIRVLEKKKRLTYRVEGQTHIYRPSESPKKSRSRVIRELVKHVFGGSPASLVLHMVETGDLTREDLDAIRQELQTSQSQDKEKSR
jgi:BlaI family penicillinase repressor